MTYDEIVAKIELVKGNYLNGNIDGEEMCEVLDDLCCDISECNNPFNLMSNDDSTILYDSFEETDFTDLVIDE
jgi:hypothetical protein